MERMGPLDASFLYLEDGVTHLHIAGCAVLEGPAPSYESVIEAIAAKLDRVPRYRQVVRFVPFDLSRPVWVDDPHFNLAYHLRHTALPSPGGQAELEALMGRLMSQELDRHRPLWEAWMVEGLEDGCWALVTKIHHCMADGVSGTGLLAVILDAERAPTAPPVPREWSPSPEPSRLRLLGEATFELALSPLEQLRAAERLLARPRRLASSLGAFADGLGSYAKRLAPTKSTSLVGPIGPNRRWTFARVELDELKRVGRRFGVTVNDVILGVLTGAFRELLLSRREPVDEVTLRSLVPVSVRHESEQGTYNNRVSAMFAELPVFLADPVDRLLAVSGQMRALKASHQTEAGETITALAEVGPFSGVALGERTAVAFLRRVSQHSVNTVTTNVPGPQFPLYLAGRELLDYLPFVPIAHGVRVGAAIVSYNGKVAFGLTGDYDTTPDLAVLAEAVEEGVRQLTKLV